MKKTNWKSIIALVAALALSITCFAGCGNKAENTAGLFSGGVLCLKVNPEIAVRYDEAGKVTAVEARNEDAKKILESYTGYEGKEARTVVTELVSAIGAAGYFVEEIEGEKRQITIEIETGSSLPSQQFMDDIVSDVRKSVRENNWQSPVEVRGESDYGITDYIDTDYGVNNDGVTDYVPSPMPANTNAPVNIPGQPSGQAPVQNYGRTDYHDTDYGPNNDGVTDYNDTDYGPNNDGVTDYNDTDYGPNNDGVTDYGNTDYGSTNYGNTNYNDGNSDYFG